MEYFKYINPTNIYKLKISYEGYIANSYKYREYFCKSELELFHLYCLIERKDIETQKYISDEDRLELLKKYHWESFKSIQKNYERMEKEFSHEELSSIMQRAILKDSGSIWSVQDLDFFYYDENSIEIQIEIKR